MLKGWVYILQCFDGSYYTGSTNNMERRLIQHQQGEGAKYTKNRRPVKLVYCEEFERVDDAFHREKHIQGWSRVKKEALIDGRFDDLPALSASTSSPTKCLANTGSPITVPPSTVPEPVEGKGGNAAKQARLEIEKQTGATLSWSKGEAVVSPASAKALGYQGDSDKEGV